MKSYSVPRDFSWIEYYKLIKLMKIFWTDFTKLGFAAIKFDNFRESFDLNVFGINVLNGPW